MTSRAITSGVAAAVIAALAVTGGAVAYAYWGAGGGGSAAGTAGTTVAVSISAGVPVAGLLPGGQSNVVLTVSNPNLSPVSFGSLSLATGQGNGGFSIDSGHSGCPVTSLSFTAQTNSGAGWTVPAKVGSTNGSLPITLNNSLSMSANAANACQGATLSVYLSAAP